MNLRIAGIVKESVVDGPGMRFVIFTQGCSHHCPGCQNPQTHDPKGGQLTTTDVLKDEIVKAKLIRGVTFSGGEPFEQPQAMAELAKFVKRKKLHLMAYSGYTFEQLFERAKTEPSVEQLLRYLDMLVDGPFVIAKKDITLAYRGSANQRILDVPKSLKKGEAVLWEDPNEAILKMFAPK